MSDPIPPDLDVIVPNLHWRYSGVTAANRMIAPRLARRFALAWLGSDAPDGVARLSPGSLLRLRFRKSLPPLIWHARRNDEMMAGLLLRLFGWPLRLVFTSAAQRHHSWTTRALIRRMDAVIATGEASAAYLQRAATVIPHGIDTDRYRPPPDRDAVFAAAGLPGKYAIGCFGRVRPQKGTDVFVEAMCRLLPRYPDFCAVLIGQVTPDQRRFEAALRERARAAKLTDRIRFLGELSIEDVAPWYRRLLIYAFTSRTEGFGLTLLEAMASGNALVAARAGAAETVIAPDTGVLVPPGDVEALVAALEPLMRNPEQAAAMGARARARVVEQFSAEREADRIAELYAQVRGAKQAG